MRFPILLACLASSLTAACGEKFYAGNEGDPCVRTIECGPGLACVDQLCSTDLTSIGGMVPVLDAGADAAAADAATDAATSDAATDAAADAATPLDAADDAGDGS